jgi:hypothetical protein
MTSSALGNKSAHPSYLSSLIPFTDLLHSALDNQNSEVTVRMLKEADDFLVGQENFWSPTSSRKLPSVSRYIVAIMYSVAHAVVRWQVLRRMWDSPLARTQFLAAAHEVAENISAAADAEILHLWFDAGVTKVSGIGLCSR